MLPTAEPVPLTRKSPALHRAVLIVTWSVAGVMSTVSVLVPAVVVTVSRNVKPLFVIWSRMVARCRSLVMRIRSRHSRRIVPTQRSACAFARGPCGGVFDDGDADELNTASKTSVNLASRTRGRNRNRSTR
jgi:hypothetical protein